MNVNDIRVYRLRQKSTGLYFCGIKIIPPLTKKGIPSKARIIPRSKRRGCRYELIFAEDVYPLEYDQLRYRIESAMACGVCISLEDIELETLCWQKISNDMNLEETLSEIGQQMVADKLIYG